MGTPSTTPNSGRNYRVFSTQRLDFSINDKIYKGYSRDKKV